METAFSYFAEVVRRGSIRQAAERLHISSSSISRQIQKLEHAFGARLLVRHSQGVRLTPAGEAVARFVQSRAREVGRLRASIDALKGLQSGHVSIYTVEGTIGGLLPTALAAFSGRYPGITYEVLVAGTDDVIQAVVEDRCDIGISFHAQPRPDVEALASIRQSLLAVMAPTHPLGSRALIELSEIGREPVGLPDRSFGIRHLVDHVVTAEQMELNVRLETNSIHMIRQFALYGMGIVFLPAFTVERELASGQLVGIPITNATLSTPTTQICKRSETELTDAAVRFVDVLVETATEADRVASNAARRANLSPSAHRGKRAHSPG